MLLALLASLALTQPLPALPIEGQPGHIAVEAKVGDTWVEVQTPSYRLSQARRSIRFPAELAPQGTLTLRLRALDNDETQVDLVSLAGGSLLSAKDTATGQDLLGKLSKADRDVAEIQGTEVLLSFKAPAGAQELSLELEARSSNNATIPTDPFRLGARALKDADCKAEGPMRLAARDGAELRIETGVMATGSGHPEAPLMGGLKIEGGRLKGRLDFGPDNDPGADDYASIVAYDAKGRAKEFKVTLADSRHGKAAWVYGEAASWQHMRFDFDIALADLPRAKDGGLALELLAYGTCSTAGPNADYRASALTVPTVTIPSNLTWTVSVANAGTATTPNTNATIQVTTKLFSPTGATLSTQTMNVVQDGGGCGYTPSAAVFNHTVTCSGTYTVWADAQGTGGDPNTSNPAQEQTVVVSGGSPCTAATPTPTPYAAPAPTVAMNSPRRGEPMIIAFPKPAKASKIIIYNLELARVAELVSGPGSARWETGAVAPGIYLLRITANFEDGSNLDVWKKAVIQP